MIKTTADHRACPSRQTRENWKPTFGECSAPFDSVRRLLHSSKTTPPFPALGSFSHSAVRTSSIAAAGSRPTEPLLTILKRHPTFGQVDARLWAVQMLSSGELAMIEAGLDAELQRAEAVRRLARGALQTAGGSAG